MGKLEVGVNDLQTWCENNGEWGQQLIEEWVGLDEENNKIEMNEISRGSKLKVYWKCKNNHTWLTTILARTGKNKTGCAKCKGRQASLEDNLLTYCKKIGTYGDRIIDEWVGLDEYNKSINMDEVVKGSRKKVYWKCNKCGNTWIAEIRSRLVEKTGCKTCYLENASKIAEEAKFKYGVNDLLTWCNSNKYGENILEDWTGKDENGDDIDITTIAYSSHKVLLWRCKNKHEWYASLNSRTNSKCGCRVCSDIKMSEITHNNRLNIGENDLLTWCNNNGEYGRQLLEEWQGIDEYNNCININEYTYASNEKVYWKCPFGHMYLCSITQKTRSDINKRTGCVVCNTQNTSYPEQLIYQSLKELYSNCQNRYRAFGNIEYDIALINDNIYIEYSPIYTHKNKQERDELKARLCIENNIRFIYISDEFIYDTLENKHITINDNDIDMMDKILNLLGHNISEIKIKDIQNKAYEYSHGKLDEAEKISTLFPELIKEVHENNEIDIAKISTYSSIRLSWKCNNCGYGTNGEWVTSVSSRTSQKSGCPKCGYNWSIKKVNYNNTKVITVGINDLASINPELAKEYSKDNIKPLNEIRNHSGNIVNWECNECGYKWKRSVSKRIYSKNGCPNCGYNWYKAQTGQPQKLKKMKPRSQVQSLSEFI